MLHVLPTPGFKQAEIKLNLYKYCTKTPIIIYAEFTFILEQSGRQVKHNTYTQLHKVCATAAVLTSSCYNFEHQTIMKVGKNALAQVLDTLNLSEAEIVAILQTSRASNRLSARQQMEYDNATGLYICRHEYVERETTGFKVRDHDHVTSWFIGAAHCQCNLERPVSFKISVFFHKFCGYYAHLIVQKFGKRSNRKIKVIN